MMDVVQQPMARAGIQIAAEDHDPSRQGHWLPRGEAPKDDAEDFIRCPACKEWIDCRDLGQVFGHEGPLPHGSTTMTGAQFEIRIDGTPRTYRDLKNLAIESAEFLKSKNPQSVVEVKDLQSGLVTAIAHKVR